MRKPHQEAGSMDVLPRAQDKKDLAYSQIAHFVSSNYDVTFIFYQIEPEQQEGLTYTAKQKEVAKIVMPKSSAKEFAIALNDLIAREMLSENKESQKKK